MVSVRQLVAYLAVAATAGLGANARGVDADAARAVEATTDVIADVVAPKHGITVLAHEDLESGISNTDDWPNFSKLPLVGMITTNDDARSVAVLSQYPEDNRGGGSYFATTTEDTETVLVFDVEDDGLLLQVVHNSVNASPPGLFLAVHDIFSTDRIYSGYLRMMAHPDPNKAVIWEFVEHDGKQYLQIRSNREVNYQAPYTAGWYLGVPPGSERDSKSNWLAVTPNFEDAMAVGVKPFSPL